MAKFKVGDQVRIVKTDNAHTRHLVGAEAKIVKLVGPYRGFDPVYELNIPDPQAPNFGLYAADWHLAPLTPPAADEWARSKVEQIKKWKPDPVILREKA